MMQCVDNDVTKLDAVLKLNVLDFLTYLQYAKHKGEIDLFNASLKK